MFLAEKTPGTDEAPFPTPGMTGGEIEVLGYRGMKEYELAFDGFKVKGENLLGGVARAGLQAADADLRIRAHPDRGARHRRRAVGAGNRHAICAGPQAVRRPLIEFPRIAGKLAMMAVEIMIARQLTYFSAWQKDHDKRCDLEAGMAKLLGARVAWARPTTRCRSTAATALRWNTGSAASSAMRAS
jgi:(2S)-methylsuccinyl-CoA dehydrogenase